MRNLFEVSFLIISFGKKCLCANFFRVFNLYTSIFFFLNTFKDFPKLHGRYFCSYKNLSHRLDFCFGEILIRSITKISLLHHFFIFLCPGFSFGSFFSIFHEIILDIFDFVKAGRGVSQWLRNFIWGAGGGTPDFFDYHVYSARHFFFGKGPSLGPLGPTPYLGFYWGPWDESINKIAH